jgi:hypothetical protein
LPGGKNDCASRLPVSMAKPENASVVRCAPSESVCAIVNAGWPVPAGLTTTVRVAVFAPQALLAVSVTVNVPADA